MGRTVDAVNGWMMVFRIVTPALLGILIWITTTGNAARDRTMEKIEVKLEKLVNDHSHELTEIKQRLTSVETTMKLLVQR